jgi:hypothetical protein
MLGGNMQMSGVIEYKGNKYKYLGNGCKATRADVGWRMASTIYFRCISCGYLMNGDPHVDDCCTCGKLSKDTGAGRFGSRLGDNAIEVYQKA